MKAALALIVIYVGAFLVAIQGSSSVPAQAAQQSTAKTVSAPTPIDPVKEADIRALLELVGAHDQIQDSVKSTAEQYRERLLVTVQNNEDSQAFVNTVISRYEKNFNVDQVTERLVVLYDKHYSDDEIKGLLQFYGSPLGQKVAAEGPKIAREIGEATRSAAAQAAKEAFAEVKQDNPTAGQSARFNGAAARYQQRRLAQAQQSAPAQQQTAQQQDPQ
jgi:hypothetical protein